MELVRQHNSGHFLSRAIKSLTKVHELSLIPLPYASILLAQAEGSLGSKERWDRILRLEWHNWSPGLIFMLFFLKIIILSCERVSLLLHVGAAMRGY